MSGKEKSLCAVQEKDAVADMRAAEREALAAYAAALSERLPRGVRAQLVRLFAEAAEDLCILFRAEENGEERSFSDFAAQKKQLAAEEQGE